MRPREGSWFDETGVRMVGVGRGARCWPASREPRWRWPAVRARAARQAAPDYWPTDGWRVADPEEHGVDPFALDAVDARVPDEVPALSALLAVATWLHRLRAVLRRTGPGDPDQRALGDQERHRNAGGGRAADRGCCDGLEQTVGETIPERIPEGADPSVADITLWQWLTMTSGLQWDAHGDWQRLLAAPDWVAMTLGLPVVGIPGQTYVYNTGGSHVLGVTVAKAAGKPLEDYAADVLFRPLGIAPGDWMRSPQGEVSAGSGLELTPRDMLKLGLLYLRNGEWDGEQIIDPEYAAAATTWQSAGDSTGAWAGYGYQWWITATGAGYPAVFRARLRWPAHLRRAGPRSRRRRGDRAATGPGGAANPALSHRVDRGGVPPAGSDGHPAVFVPWQRACGETDAWSRGSRSWMLTARQARDRIRDDAAPAGSPRLYPDLAAPGAAHRDDGGQRRVGLGDRAGDADQ